MFRIEELVTELHVGGEHCRASVGGGEERGNEVLLRRQLIECVGRPDVVLEIGDAAILPEWDSRHRPVGASHDVSHRRATLHFATQLRVEEEWARRMVERALGACVVQHDDGTRPAMHDLDIEYAGRPGGAIEVVAAVDARCTELWRLVNDGPRRIVQGLDGGWFLSLDPSTNVRRLNHALRPLLSDLESRRVIELDDWTRDPAVEEARRFGIVHATQGGTEFRGSVYFTIQLPTERAGGAVASTDDALSGWLGEWLRGDPRQDVRRKLRASGAAERHVFIVVPPFADGDFGVRDILLRDDAPLPATAPDLPQEVTHVWVASTWTSGDGFRWDPNSGWLRFDKVWGEDAAA